MGAERFIIEDKIMIANNLLRKADELWQKDKSQFAKVFDTYFNAFKIQPSICALSREKKLLNFLS